MKIINELTTKEKINIKRKEIIENFQKGDVISTTEVSNFIYRLVDMVIQRAEKVFEFDTEEMTNDLFVKMYDFLFNYKMGNEDLSSLIIKMKRMCETIIISWLSKEYNISIQNLRLYYKARKYLNYDEIHSTKHLISILKSDFRFNYWEVIRYLDTENALNNTFVSIDQCKNYCDTKDCFKSAYAGSLHKSLNDALSCLTKKERQIIIIKYGLNDGIVKTLDETSKILNIGIDSIRKCELNAFRKLRDYQTSKNLIQYLY